MPQVKEVEVQMCSRRSGLQPPLRVQQEQSLGGVADEETDQFLQHPRIARNKWPGILTQGAGVWFKVSDRSACRFLILDILCKADPKFQWLNRQLDEEIDMVATRHKHSWTTRRWTVFGFLYAFSGPTGRGRHLPAWVPSSAEELERKPCWGSEGPKHSPWQDFLVPAWTRGRSSTGAGKSHLNCRFCIRPRSTTLSEPQHRQTPQCAWAECSQRGYI